MLWFAIWSTLVLATLAGAALLGLRLWRKGKALLAQLKETEQVLQQLESRIDELDALRGAEPVLRPALLATPEDRERWRQLRATNRRSRRTRRGARHDQAYSRWHEVFDTQ